MCKVKLSYFLSQLCKKEFQYGASLRAHLVRHTRKTEATAAAPGAEGTGVSSVKGRTKREFVCDICGRTLPKLYSLRIHMLKHTGVKPHACKVKSFCSLIGFVMFSVTDILVLILCTKISVNLGHFTIGKTAAAFMMKLLAVQEWEN